MRLLLPMLLFVWRVCGQATLTAPPHTIEALGSPISGSVQQEQIMFQATNGDYHWVVFYNNSVACQAVDVNLTGAEAKLVGVPLGTAMTHGAIYFPSNNMVYMANNGDKLWGYDVGTGTSNNAWNLSGYGSNVQIADNGTIVIAIEQGGVDVFNPATGVIDSAGSLDPEFTDYQYSYSTGGDSRYVYVGLGQSPWYLGVYDTQDKTKSLFFKDQGDTYGAVYQRTNGGWFYRRNTTSDGIKYYWLENGTPYLVNTNPTSYCFDWGYQRGPVVDLHTYFPQVFGVSVNLDYINPTTGSNSATFKWNFGSGWQEATVTNFTLAPLNLQRLYDFDASRLFGFVDGYGPVFFYDTTSTNITLLGRTKVSLYDGLFAGGKIYLSGYTRATHVYNPSQPWTLTDSVTNDLDESYNPYQIPLYVANYHYSSALGSDGLIYVVGVHIRDATGGELGWYNPATGGVGNLREPFVDTDLRSVVASGSKIVIAGTSSNLFVLDIASKTVTNTYQPLGTNSPGTLLSVGDGLVFGASQAGLFLFNVNSSTLVYSNAVGGVPFGQYIPSVDRRLCLGPDGRVWMFVDNHLKRFEPQSGVGEAVLDTTPANLVFHGGDLYLYNPDGTTMSRVNGLLQLRHTHTHGSGSLGSSTR